MEEKNTISNYNTVYLTLKDIFKSRFELDIEEKGDIFKDKHLLGTDIKLNARYLVYLYFDIEKAFGITLPDEDIAEGKFSTFNNIAQIICKQLQKKHEEIA